MIRTLLARTLLVLALLSVSATAVAQEATPTPGASPSGDSGLSLVASGLANPRGMAWDSTGTMYVALAGTGGDTPGMGDEMGEDASENLGGPTAGVAKVVGGCGVPVISGLPSVRNAVGHVSGVAAVAFLGDTLYLMVEGGGASNGNPGQRNGVYRLGHHGDAIKLNDLGTWIEVNPVAHIPGDFTANGDPFALIAGGDRLYAVESNNGQVLGVSPDGNMSRVADLSDGHPVPTGIARDAEGNLYVGYLTAAPWTPGGSRVDKIAPDGTVSTVWTGLTQVTGVAVGQDGALYALEAGAGNGWVLGSGRLVRQTGPDSSTEVVTGLNLPVGLAVGPDGAFYVSLPAFAPTQTQGGILRVDPSTTGPVAYNPNLLRATVCGTGTGGTGTGTVPGSTPTAAATPAPVVRVASDLANPRGMTWDDAGSLYVAQAGTGETATSVGTAGSVVTVEKGCPVEVASGLPSSFDPFRDVLGPEDVAVMDGHLYVLQGATGPLEKMDPKRPNGVYRVDPGGTLTLVADLTTWLNNNPVENPPPDRNPLGEPYRLLPDDGFLWFVDSNSGEVDRVDLDGTVTRLADTSATHKVATAFARSADGGFYVGFLDPAPHPDGAAVVIKVTANGYAFPVWTGLTAITGIAVAPDGSLYASELATGNETKEGMRPNTGRIVRQTGPSSLEEVVTGLDYPIDLVFGPDGDLYVSGPAFGGDDRDGWILKVEPSITTPYAVPAELMTDSDCPGDDATPQAGALPTAAPPMVAPTAAPAANAAPTVAPTGEQAAVTIKNYAFDPPTLTIKAGTTVTWTNDDQVPHTATAADGSFDSGNLNPGQTFSHTFGSPGTFDYVCSYHAGMKGTVVVEP